MRPPSETLHHYRGLPSLRSGCLTGGYVARSRSPNLPMASKLHISSELYMTFRLSRSDYKGLQRNMVFDWHIFSIIQLRKQPPLCP